jgi:hypothetical protein
LRTRILWAAAAATTALLTAATPAWADPHPGQPFAAQAEAVHLSAAQTTALQSKVDDYLKKVGGKQVALNRIVFNGGEVRVTVPGEAHPRNLEPVTGSRVDKYDPCIDGDFANGWFCTYQLPVFQGDELSWYYCRRYYDMPWLGHGSWINNQTHGTKAQFWGGNNNLLYTTPGAYSSSEDYGWGPVFKIYIC